MGVRDPELALLIACAAWPPSPARAEAVRLAAGAIDWERFVRIVSRHRMAGMALHGLTAAALALPAEPGRRLRQAAAADVRQALNTAREAARLISLLADAGIAALVLKGPPLAVATYGTLAVRQISDLDLLVSPGDLARALGLIRAQGYALAHAGGDEALRPDRSAMLKDVELHHPATGMVVELHARLSENAELLPMSLVGAAQSVAIAPGMDLPTLTGTPLLLYLMVHGFRHSWCRLKWLADVAAIVGTMSTTDLAIFLNAAPSRRLHVVVASTLLLVQNVMGTDLPPCIERAVRRGRRARLCAWVARGCLSDERAPDHQGAFKTLGIATLLLASPSPRYLRREIGRLIVDYPFALRHGGGRAVTTLSMMLRPLLWSARNLGRTFRK